MHITNHKINYDMIIGRDLLSELGIKIDFSDSTIEWDNAMISMKSIDVTPQDSYSVKDSTSMTDATERMK